MLRSYEAGRLAVAQLNNPRLRALLQVALIGAAMDCCNATRDGKCLRFPRGWTKHQQTADRLSARFESRANVVAADLEEVPLRNSEARIQEGDARNLIGGMKERFRICVLRHRPT